MKSKLKRGGNIENNYSYLDEILHKINLQIVLAMQITPLDKIVRSDTVQDLNDFNSQFLVTHAKKGEQLGSMMPAFKKLKVK